MKRIKILVDLNGRRRGDIVLPTENPWKFWADNKSIFETSLICEYIDEPEEEVSKEVHKKPEKKKGKR